MYPGAGAVYAGEYRGGDRLRAVRRAGVPDLAGTCQSAGRRGVRRGAVRGDAAGARRQSAGVHGAVRMAGHPLRRADRRHDL